MGYEEAKIERAFVSCSDVEIQLLWDIHTLQKENYETFDFVKSLDRAMRIRLLRLESLELIIIERNDDRTQNFIIHNETLKRMKGAIEGNLSIRKI